MRSKEVCALGHSKMEGQVEEGKVAKEDGSNDPRGRKNIR